MGVGSRGWHGAWGVIGRRGWHDGWGEAVGGVLEGVGCESATDEGRSVGAEREEGKGEIREKK